MTFLHNYSDSKWIRPRTHSLVVYKLVCLPFCKNKLSRGVLARVLQNTVSPRWRLPLQPLQLCDVPSFIRDPHISGTLVNEDGRHWTAIVKHAACTWHVDSLASLRLLTVRELCELLIVYPSTYALLPHDSDA